MTFDPTALNTREACVAADRADPLSGFRDEFALPEGVIYLDGNSLGALPRAAGERAREVLAREWGEDLIASWNTHHWFELPVRIERPEHEVAGNRFAAGRDAAHDERRHRRQIEQELGRVAEDQGDLLRRRRAGALQSARIADTDAQQALAGEQGRLGLVTCEAEAAEREPRDLRDRHGTLGEHVRAAAHASHEPSAPGKWRGQHDGRACVPIASDRLACRLQHAALRIDGSRRDKPGSIGGQLDRLDADPFAARAHLGAAERARCQAPIALHLHVLGAISTGDEGEREGDLLAPVAEEHDHGRSQEHVERIDCVMRS